MTSSSCEADVHNWDDRKDDLSGALDHAEKAALMGRRGQALSLTECEQKITSKMPPHVVQCSVTNIYASMHPK